jgi:hypothetical protein
MVSPFIISESTARTDRCRFYHKLI